MSAHLGPLHDWWETGLHEDVAAPAGSCVVDYPCGAFRLILWDRFLSNGRWRWERIISVYYADSAPGNEFTLPMVQNTRMWCAVWRVTYCWVLAGGVQVTAACSASGSTCQRIFRPHCCLRYCTGG
jgi:hypothetical protein